MDADTEIAIVRDLNNHGAAAPEATCKWRDADLSKASAYSVLDHKSITAWKDLRNKVAHGKFPDYTIEQVRLMAQSVRDFIARTHT